MLAKVSSNSDGFKTMEKVSRRSLLQPSSRKSLYFINPTIQNTQYKVQDTQINFVEASRHRGHCSFQMDAPFQLKIIPASINLQKTFGQRVWTHPPMVLLASFLIFSLSSFWVRKLTFFHCMRAFYSVRSSVPFNGGKTFWLVMMVLRWWQSHHCPLGGCHKLWEGWIVVILVFSLYRRRGVGCDRLLEVTQESPVEHAFGSVENDDLRFTAKAFS